MSGQASQVERVALVTGASTGIGLAVARRLRRDGFALGFHTKDEDAESKACFEEVAGTDGVWVPADLSDPTAPARVVRDVVQGLGRLDVLVNNAGISLSRPALELTAEDFDTVFAVDVKAPFLLSVAAHEPMRRAGGGSIVNTASFVAKMGAATSQVAYTASKGAVLAFTRELAVIHAREGIRVNNLCPGPLRTELLMKFLDTDAKKQRRLVHIPMGRFGEAAEIARAALFLASDDSSFMTGAELLVDGGITAAYVTPE
jgi:NAD(P)-dependent dehydrogenase (short-subunit alcohol dehydrogenase family)